MSPTMPCFSNIHLNDYSKYYYSLHMGETLEDNVALSENVIIW